MLRQAVAGQETAGFHVAPTALQEEYLSLNGRTTARGLCHTGARHGRRIGGGDRGRLLRGPQAQARDPRTPAVRRGGLDRHRSEEHTSELQSLMRISYAVFCLKKQIVIAT